LLRRTHYTVDLPSAVGSVVVLAGWVHDVRLIGGLNFIVLRDKEGFAQIVVRRGSVPEKLMELVRSLHQEDVIVVRGRVVPSREAKQGVELIPSELEVINRAASPLPLDPRDVTPASLETRLNWRHMDFRRAESAAIFRIQTEILRAFREFCLGEGFIEIQPPVIIGSASEGGAELFEIPYFEKKAYLAQSPQLYKQLCAISFERVFTVVPVFRAEKFEQPTHLNEIRQMDVEMAFADDEDAMNMLERCFHHILDHVRKNAARPLEILGRDLRVPTLPLKRITYEEALKLLEERGAPLEWGSDFSKTQEKILTEAVGQEAFFIKDWPAEAKPFYAMPHEGDPRLVKAYDLLYNGVELASGTQRIHIPELLERRLVEKGLNPESFRFYIDAFRYGAPPHAGWSIGLERITMTVCGRSNIREATMFPRDRNRLVP